MSLDKVTYEGEGIPLQQVEPQGTSLEAADTHALLVENDLEDVSSDSASPSPSCTLFVMSVSGRIKKNCLLATRVPCESGFVHNKELKTTQGKFLIQEVLDEWEGFDADIHSVEDTEVRYRKKRRAGSVFRKNRKSYCKEASSEEEGGESETVDAEE